MQRAALDYLSTAEFKRHAAVSMPETTIIETTSRPTNVAEGFHNGLNSRFGMSHPSLRLFLDWLQKYHFEVQCRGMQLASGRPAKQRPATYVQLDENLWAAKLSYSVDYGRIFRDFAFHLPTALAHSCADGAVSGACQLGYLLGCH